MIYSFEDQTPKQDPDCFIAETAVVIGNVTLKNQSSIWFGAVLRGDIEPIEIGERTNIQDNSVVHTKHDAPVKIGNDVSVGHLVNLHGCTVGNNCVIGMGATLLDGCVIGDNCIIGANTLIPPNKTIPAGSLVIGSPGRIARPLTEEEIAGIKENADHYVQCYPKYLHP